MQRETSQPDLFTTSLIPTVSPDLSLGGSRATATSAGASSSAGAAAPVPALGRARASREAPPPMPREKPPGLAPAPPILARLTDEHLRFTPVGSRFESIAAQTLDNAGTGEDGFDDMHAAIVQAFGDDAPALSSLDQHLTDADFVPGEFADAYHAPIIAEVQPLLDAGDSTLSELAGTFSGTIAPIPAPDIPAPDIIDLSGGGGDVKLGDPLEGTNLIWIDWGSLFNDNISG